MESFKAFRPILVPITLVILSLISVNGQISTPCTSSRVSTFTPCISYITGSTSNGSSPTQDCCALFKSLLGTGMDCACLLVTGNVPIQLPINRTLALSLPRACNTDGVPLQCKASASPIAAPGPAFLLGPTPSPTSASSLSPRASKAVATAPSPQSGTADDLEPESPSVEPEAPTQTTPGQIGRSTPLPSASSLSYVSPPSLLIILGILVLKSY